MEELFTGAALVLSAMATVAVAVTAFYDPRGSWIIEVRQLARLQALDRRLADQTARSTSITHEDVDRLRDDFEALMEAHLTAWTWSILVHPASPMRRIRNGYHTLLGRLGDPFLHAVGPDSSIVHAVQGSEAKCAPRGA
jgi:hypothetical protein